MATIKPKKVIIKKRTRQPQQPLEIQQPIITFTTTKEKGDAYEKFIKHDLLNSGNYKQVYLWRDVPEADLFACGIMDDWNTARLRRKTAKKEGLLGDIGTDLLVLGQDDKYSIIQCKYYDEEAKLRIEDLGTFYFMMMNYHQMVNGIVYHTCKLSHLLELHNTHNNLIQYKQHPFNHAKYRELMDTIYKPINTESNTKLIPFDYQLEAINALKGKSRTVCQLPCGCGKTLIAIKLCEAYKQNIIITPLKSYCEQNLERFQSQMDSEYKMIIIDSDGDGRNMDKIQDFIKKNAKICLFVTFKSVDIINELINNGLLNDYFIVIDEFHNISINDILEVEEDFEELQNTNLEIEKESDSDEEIR
jgi:predicted helicase